MRSILVGTAALVLACGAVVPAADAATPSVAPHAVHAVALGNVGYTTGAYGTYIAGAVAGNGISSGPTAATGINCTALAGRTTTNTTATANLGVAKTGAVHSTSQTIGSATSKTARSTTSVGSVNLLNGLITASAVSTTSTSTLSSAGAASGTNNTTITGLKVGGVAISANTKPNTTLTLKLSGKTIGQVIVNEQVKTTSGGTVTSNTRALEVRLTTAALGLNAGARVIVANSSAALNPVPAGFAGGDAYALKTTLLTGAVKNGPLAYQSVACAGGNRTANTASASLPSLLGIGATSTATQSSASPTLSGTATNTIASISVLNGLISATGIKASTTTTRAGKLALPVVSDHSTFGVLRVAGVPVITAAVKPNTTISLASLGKVTLHQVTRTSTGIKVVMVHIVLNKALGSLPTGSTIDLGVSETSAH